MIKYIGSKRALIPWILEVVERIHEVSPVRTAADPFCGTCRVSHALKSSGRFVESSDMNAYAYTLAQAMIEADASVYTEDIIQPMLDHLNALEGVPGFFTKTYCVDARFFQPQNGARVDSIRREIEVVSGQDPLLRSILLTSLMLAADRVDSTTGVQMAYLKSWAPRAFKDLELRYPPLVSGTGRAFQSDVVDRVHDADVDLLYLDPPYNQHAYLSNYHIWETLIQADEPEVYGIARKRIDCRTRKSPFNQKRNARAAFEAMISKIRAKTVLLSFNNEGVFDVQTLEELLAPIGKVTILWKEHKRYVGARIGIYNPSGEKVGKVSHTKNLEFILVASQNEAVHKQLRGSFEQKLDSAS